MGNKLKACPFGVGDRVMITEGFNENSSKYVGMPGVVDEIHQGRARPDKWVVWIKYSDGKRFGPYSDKVQPIVFNNRQALSLLRRD